MISIIDYDLASAAHDFVVAPVRARRGGVEDDVDLGPYGRPGQPLDPPWVSNAQSGGAS
jgi:hypothetical protein